MLATLNHAYHGYARRQRSERLDVLARAAHVAAHTWRPGSTAYGLGAVFEISRT
jgi:hypothetical protein